MKSLEGIMEKTINIPMEMYSISGYDETNSSRYFRDKKQQDEIIKKEVARFSIIRKIDNIFKDNSSFSEYSNNKNPDLGAIPALIKEAFKSNDIELIRKASEFINYTSGKYIPELVKLASSIKDSCVQKWAEYAIYSAPEKEQHMLRSLFPKKIKEVYLKNDGPILVNNDKKKLEVGEKNKVGQELIEEAIEQGNFRSLNYLLPGFQFDNKIKKEKIELLLLNKIKEVFRVKNLNDMINFLPLIFYLPKNERESFILEALSCENVNLQLAAADMIPQTESYDEKVKESSKVRLFLIQKMKETFEKEGKLIPEEIAGMIKYLPEKLRPEFTIKAFEKGLGKKIIENPLYSSHPDMNDTTLKRKRFSKDGSDTTLIGGPLKDKIIIRQIEPEAFVAWQRAYENFELWKENGFDYVPIEHIQSFSYDKNKKLVDVYTAVLDINFGKWDIVSGGMFHDELSKEFNKIGEVINKMRIKHGHMKSENCCLRFFRDENGNPDITKIPRLYYIDFDQAVYYEK